MHRARLPAPQDILILLVFEILLAFQHPPRQSGSFLFNNQAVLLIEPRFSPKTLTKKSSRGQIPRKQQKHHVQWVAGWGEHGMPSTGSKRLVERENEKVSEELRGKCKVVSSTDNWSTLNLQSGL